MSFGKFHSTLTTARSAIAGPVRPWRYLVLFFMAVGSGGCTLSADENEVVIEHPSSYTGVAQYMADNHCAKFGKAASLVQMGIEETYSVGMRKRASVFQCIGKAQPQPQPKAGK